MPTRIASLWRPAILTLALLGAAHCGGPAANDTRHASRHRIAAHGARTLSYAVARATTPIDIDGHATEPAWNEAVTATGFAYPWHPGSHPPTYVRLLWDDDNLYITIHAVEPDVQATVAERQGPLWEDGRVMVYLDFTPGDGRYYALEVNALGALLAFDADLSLPTPGERFDWRRWDASAIAAAAHVDGALNNPATPDRGYSVELAVPWRALPAVDAGAVRAGMTFRVGLFRIHQRRGEPAERWPHGVWSAEWAADPTFHHPPSFVTATLVND